MKMRFLKRRACILLALAGPAGENTAMHNLTRASATYQRLMGQSG